MAEKEGTMLDPTRTSQKTPNEMVTNLEFSYTARTRAKNRNAVALATAAPRNPSQRYVVSQ